MYPSSNKDQLPGKDLNKNHNFSLPMGWALKETGSNYIQCSAEINYGRQI